MTMIQTITEDMIWERIPIRRPDSHKGKYGHVLAICGCAEYRGAAALCSLGALRSGTGLLTLAAPELVIQSIASRIPEAIFLPMEEAVPPALEQAIGKTTVTAIGCGKQADRETWEQVRCALTQTRGTIVLDAGALTCLAAADALSSDPASETPLSSPNTEAGQDIPLSALALLRQAAGRTILTPHPGEMARLTGLPVGQILQMPAHVAKTYAEKTGSVVVLKGHRTFIAAPDGTLYQNQTGNAGLSRGGSGDLLTGMIAGLAAQGLSPVDAALCGVWLHGTAADRCAARRSMMGMLPEDILEDLCQIFLEHQR